MVSLLRQIIQNNPPIQVLDMELFSSNKDTVENIGELVLEALLNNNIQSIQDLNLSYNQSWFIVINSKTYEDRSSNVDLLGELISKQSGLKHINLGENYFHDNAT